MSTNWRGIITISLQGEAELKIALCLLTRNERECLEKIFPLIPSPGGGFDAIYAIDGGSTDGTVEFFRDKGIACISQKNRGRGDAMMTAFKEIEADAYIFFSPDGNEDSKDLGIFRGHLEAGADLVIASRMMEGARNEEDDNLFRPRKWANIAFNILANLLFRRCDPWIYDTINGYRAITKKAVDAIALTAPDYTIEYQMTIRAFKHGLTIKEFPTFEGERVAGETGAPSIPTGLRFIGRLFSELRA